jgi:hypothetical protein
MKVAAIVEGEGEVAAFPVLLRRLREWLTPDNYLVEINPPIRVRRDQFINKNEIFSKMLLLARAKCEESGWILVLLDADDDCPAVLGQQILARAKAVVSDRRISVVLANREYEAWFIAAAESLNGQRGFLTSDEKYIKAESIRDAKGWLGHRKADGKYREVTDQPAFSAVIDLQQAKDNSRSFSKLCAEWEKNINLLGLD